METQTPHNGLTQLFMSLGLSASPLKGIEGATSEDGAAFDSLLAGYLSAPANATSDILPGTLAQASSNATGVLSDSLLGQDLSDDSLRLIDREGLPLMNGDLGNTLPLSLPADTAHSRPIDKTALLNSQDNVDNLGSDQDGQALLHNQGFYAQSLVSSLMPVKPLEAPAMNALSASMKSASEGTGAVAMMNLNSLANKNSGLESTATTLDADALSFDADVDQFLGATINQEGNRGDKPLKSISALSAQQPLVEGLNTVSAEQVNITNIALSMNEDPTDVSLQELSDIDDIEKTNVEQKLSTLERKQDEQTLKLSKGQQAWGDALAGRITMNAAKDIQQVTIHLDPPELGSLELKLNVKDDQQTHVQVNVQNPQVKEALESSANRLREMLAEQGLELSEFDVQTGSQQENQNKEHNPEADSRANQQDSDALASDEETIINIPTPKNNNLLDTFV